VRDVEEKKRKKEREREGREQIAAYLTELPKQNSRFQLRADAPERSSSDCTLAIGELLARNQENSGWKIENHGPINKHARKIVAAGKITKPPNGRDLAERGNTPVNTLPRNHKALRAILEVRPIAAASNRFV